VKLRARPAFDAYRTQGFDAVFGWCSGALLTFLELIDEIQSTTGLSGAVGEIGVQDGKLFIALHNLLHDKEPSLAIDLFDNQRLNVDGSGGGAQLAVFQQNLQRHAKNPQMCTAMQIDSMELGVVETQQILAKFGKFRLFSIDGSHTIDHTINDFLFAEKVLANGGIVMVDDYYNPYFPEVHQAIGHLYSQHRSKLAPLFYQCSKMFFTTAAYVSVFQRAIIDHFHDNNPNEPMKMCNFYGYPIVLLDNWKH
jgi:hypothetical protein